MATEDNKKIVRRFVEEFKNKANHNIVYELFANDAVIHLPLPGLPPNRDALKMLGGQVVKAFPDVHATIEDLRADGDRVIERTTTRATHRGEFFGAPPTNKPVAWTETHIYRIVNNKIAELWSEINILDLLMQIGAIPPPKA